MPYNRIVIKDGNRTTESFTKPVANAVKPGTLVKLNSSGNFTTAGSGDDNQRLFVLGDRDNFGETVETTYTANDTGIAYELIPNRTVQIRGIAATFTEGQPVTIADGGKVTATVGANDKVLGHVDFTATVTDNQLVEVRLT